MIRMLKNKQGYALITAVALIAVVMALCSMLVAHSFYGRALSQSAEMRFEEDRRRAAEGSEFIALAEIYGDGLLDAYAAMGYDRIDDDTVSWTDGDTTTTITRGVTQTRDVFRTVTFYYGDGERFALQVPRGEAPGDAAAACESGYTPEGSEYRWFVGWDCDGDGVAADYRSCAEIPASEYDTAYWAVYADAAEFTLTVITGEGGEETRTKIPYRFGETLGEVLRKIDEEGQPYVEDAESYRCFAQYERNIGDALGRYLTAANAAELRSVLAQCEAGEEISVTGPLEEAVYVNRAVTIRISDETDLLPPADGFSIENVTPQGSDVTWYRYEALSKVYIKDSTGASPKVTEYRGRLTDVVRAVNEIGGENCYANENCTIPGICVMGDTVLQADLETSAPLIVFPDRTVTVNLNGYTLTGGEVLFRLESGAQLRLLGGNGGIVRAQKTPTEMGTALQIIGAAATLADVHVKGDLLAYQGAETKLVGGSLAGMLNAWGSGSLSVEGTAAMPYVLDGGTAVSGSVAAGFTYCRFASGSFSAQSSAAAVLRLCTFAADDSGAPLVEKSGSYYELSYVGGEQQEQSDLFTRMETLYRPVYPDETLSGAPVLYAMPADTGIITYYDAEGVPVRTLLFEGEAQFATESYLYRGETVNKWTPLTPPDDAEELLDEDGNLVELATVKEDLEVRPVFPESSPAAAAVVIPAATGRLEVQYYVHDLTGASGFRTVTAAKTLRGGDHVVFAYYTPGRSEPDFFVSGTKTLQRGSSAFEECLRDAALGGSGTRVIVPVCSLERITWSRVTDSELMETPQEWSGEESVFSAGNYIQGHSVHIVWPDGSVSTGDCVPHGAKLCFRLYTDEEQDGMTLFHILEDIEEGISGVYGYDFFVTKSVLRQGTATNGGRFFLYTTYEDAGEWEGSFQAVTDDLDVVPFSGEYHYISRGGEAVVVSCSGVPAGRDVIYAYCQENGEVLFYADRYGVYPTDEAPDALPPDWQRHVSDGYYYDGSVLVVVIYRDHALTWFHPEQDAVDPWHTNAAYPLYAEQEGTPCYILSQMDDSGWEKLSIGVRTTDFKIIKWAVA